jgi:hypothetical protein
VKQDTINVGSGYVEGKRKTDETFGEQERERAQR